jgi:hypothetical protein
MLKKTYFIAVTLLLGLLSFVVTASAGVPVTLVWSLAMAALSLLFVRLISSSVEPPSDIAPMLMGGIIVALGAGLKWLAGSPTVGWPDSVAILISVGAAWGLDVLFAGGGNRQCFICKRPIAERAPFACPRCHQAICTLPSCWIARHFRCRSCDEREVIIFPIDEQWWRTRLGPRVSNGSCNSCYKEANEADLRACGRCRWAMCRRCWDYHNGQCTHCEWIVPDPPSALRPYLGTSEAFEPGRIDREARRQQ